MRRTRGQPIDAWLMYSFFNRSAVRSLALHDHELRVTMAGFTLIELLIVIVVIGILMAIAVPSYLGLSAKATNRTAEQQIRAAIPDVEAFYVDNGTYVGLGNTAKKTPPGLVSYDSNLAVKVGTGNGAPTASNFCLNATADSKLSARGPAPITWFTKANCAGTGVVVAP